MSRRQSFEAMVQEVEGMLSRFDSPAVEALATGIAGSGFHLIGTSGTVTTLAGVHLDLPRYDRRKRRWPLAFAMTRCPPCRRGFSHGISMRRAANPCIGPDRADLVLAGCAILEAIRRRWPIDAHARCRSRACAKAC